METNKVTPEENYLKTEWYFLSIWERGDVVLALKEYADTQTKPLLERIEELDKDNLKLLELSLIRKIDIKALKSEIERLKEELQTTLTDFCNYRVKANKLADAFGIAIEYYPSLAHVQSIMEVLNEFKEGDKNDNN